MKKQKIRCPCCDKEIIIKFNDTADIQGVFFDGMKISEDEAFDKYGMCFGLGGGVIND